MKNNILQSILPLLFLCMVEVSHAQYVTLKEKQFYDQSGQPFYPVICNYDLKLNCNNCNTDYMNWNPAVSDIELHPNYQYGASLGVDEPFTRGTDKILADLNKIKSMGFNTIRAMGLFANMHDHFRVNAEEGARIICVKQTDPTSGQGYWGYPFVIKPPYNTNSNLQNVLIPKYQQLLDLAAQANVKVILVLGGEYVSKSANSVKGVDQAQEYRDILLEVANSLKDKTALLAYDLYNEPGFNIYGNQWGPGGCTRDKEEICNFTAMWYDAIKTKDPNHLVTMSNTSLDDVLHYDPTIMKLDFNCLHIYPYWLTRRHDNFNRDNAFDRLKAIFYWMNNNSSLPWVLSETAVSAWSSNATELGQSSNTALTTYTNYYVGENLSAMPYVWGTLDEQASYALQLQKLVANYGGSGIGWWMYQDVNFDKPFDKFDNSISWKGDDPKLDIDVNYNFCNLLTWGNPCTVNNQYVYDQNSTCSLNKPIVTTAFSSNTVYGPDPATPAVQPTNYYDAFGGGQFYQFLGAVTDNNTPSNVIKDAVIFASNNGFHTIKRGQLNVTAPELQFSRDLAVDIFTFTMADGLFYLKSPVSSPAASTVTNQYDYGKFDVIKISSTGASVAKWEDNPYGAPQPFPAFNTFRLNRNLTIFEKQAVGFTINSGSQQTYTARHSLLVQNGLVKNGGQGDFKASVEVNVQPGFEAELGSETFLHIETVKPDCNLLSAPYLKTDETSFKTIDEDLAKEIEVHYDLTGVIAAISPNPANQYVNIHVEESGTYNINIYNQYGSKVLVSQLFVQGSSSLNVADLSPGNYTLQVNSKEINKYFKLIINR